MDFMEKIWKHFFSMQISTFETIFDPILVKIQWVEKCLNFF